MKKLILTAIIVITSLTLLSQTNMIRYGMIKNGVTYRSEWKPIDRTILQREWALVICSPTDTIKIYRTSKLYHYGKDNMGVMSYRFKSNKNRRGIISRVFFDDRPYRIINRRFKDSTFIELKAFENTIQ